jgi:hypothetical protein
MKAIEVTDQAAGTAGMRLVERPEPPAAINDGASGGDDVSAEHGCGLRHHRPDCAGRQAGADREVDVARERRQVAGLDGHVLRQGAVAMPVRQAEPATGRAADRQKALDFGAQEFVDLDNDVLEAPGG